MLLAVEAINVYFAFEESRSQIIRNMKSIGIDLEQWASAGLLEFKVSRPTHFGLEMHLVNMYRSVTDFKPQVVVVDPISTLTAVGSAFEVKLMLTRMIDFLKLQNITLILLDLSSVEQTEQTNIGISSLADTWIALRQIESNGERNRGLYILKSRGIAHSNQIREFVLTSNGVKMLDVYTGTDGFITGSARYAQEEKESIQRMRVQRDVEQRRRDIDRKRQTMEARIADIRASFEAESEELGRIISQEEEQLTVHDSYRERLAIRRKADSALMTRNDQQ